jgi:hypothetical protein
VCVYLPSLSRCVVWGSFAVGEHASLRGDGVMRYHSVISSVSDYSMESVSKGNDAQFCPPATSRWRWLSQNAQSRDSCLRPPPRQPCTLPVCPLLAPLGRCGRFPHELLANLRSLFFIETKTKLFDKALQGCFVAFDVLLFGGSLTRGGFAQLRLTAHFRLPNWTHPWHDRVESMGNTSISIPEDDEIRIRLVNGYLGAMLHGSGFRFHGQAHAPPSPSFAEDVRCGFGKTRIANLGVSCGPNHDDVPCFGVRSLVRG